MSYRIYIAYSEDDKGEPWADAFIPFDASDEEIAKVASDLYWRLPMRIFTPSEEDLRFRKLTMLLDDMYSMCGSYSVWIRDKTGVRYD